jgi:hypothetical protein
MLFVLKGGDRSAVLRRIAAIAKDSGGLVSQFMDTVTPEAIDPLFSESLFGEKTVAVFDGLLRFPEDVRALLFSRTKQMATSGNVFILVDELWNAEANQIFKESGIVPEVYASADRPREANPFVVSDAIMARDKKTSWLTFSMLLADGVAAEELHGTIFWAVKSMLLCKNGGYGKTEQELAMKPYAYQKATRGATKYSKTELEQYAKALTDLLEQTRKSGGDLGIALERLLLVTV